MFPRSSLLGCISLVVGCAAAQVDDIPDHYDGDDTPTAGTSSDAGTGGKPSTTGGSGSVTAGTAATKAGSSSGGTSTGTAGSSSAGSAGKGAGGGSGSGAGGSGGSGGGGGTKPANTNLPFTEDFEDGEANGFIPWNDKNTPGMWAVVADGAGKIYGPAAAPSDLEFAVGGSTSWSDVAMSVKVRLKDDNAGAQIVIRFKDPKTYLFVEMAIGKYKLRARANGSTTDLISPSPKPTIVAGMWHTVGITVKGSMATLTLDTMPIGTPVAVNALISNGGVALGVAEGEVAFDDLKVDAAP